MVGGTVIETINAEDRIWVNCKDGADECAIYIELTDTARCVSPGDELWWHGRHAFWIPYHKGERVGPRDVKIPRIGNSGAPKPNPTTP